APQGVQFNLSSMLYLLDSASSSYDGINLYSDFTKESLDFIHVPVELCGGRIPTGSKDVNRSFHLCFRRLHQIHNELESILITASEIPTESFAAERQHPATNQLLCLTGNAFNVVTDDP